MGGACISPNRYSMFAKPCFWPVSSELHHLGGVIDRDDFFRVLSEQLRQRSFAGAEISNCQWRQQRNKTWERPATTARERNFGQIARQLIEIFTRFVLAFAQSQLQRGAVARVSGISRATFEPIPSLGLVRHCRGKFSRP